jgi:TonB dependent receptor
MLALYVEDQIKAGDWNFNLGMLGDIYNGLTAASQAQPRVGVSYNIKPTSTVLSVSYARTRSHLRCLALSRLRTE